ncbi:hypothetical protein Stsp01_55380 [Streptomyces sp. NBRC 13847]|nr:hypothetical protein Stsp01_55380 [Streptomyces sp. NBRC 13847]
MGYGPQARTGASREHKSLHGFHPGASGVRGQAGRSPPDAARSALGDQLLQCGDQVFPVVGDDPRAGVLRGPAPPLLVGEVGDEGEWGYGVERSAVPWMSARHGSGTWTASRARTARAPADGPANSTRMGVPLSVAHTWWVASL